MCRTAAELDSVRQSSSSSGGKLKKKGRPGGTMKRSTWVVVLTGGLLMLGCRCQSSGTVGGGGGGVDAGGDRAGDDEAATCVGADCTRSHLNNNNNIIKAGQGHHSPLQPGSRPSPRAKRQMVVVEVEGEKSHRVPCTRKEEGEAACINGKCFALDMGQLRTPYCHCPAKYEGPRCELLSAYYFINYYAQMKKGAIIGGVVIGVILIIVAASIYCSYRKGKRRRKERQDKPDSWEEPSGQATKSEKRAMIDGESQV